MPSVPLDVREAAKHLRQGAGSLERYLPSSNREPGGPPLPYAELDRSVTESLSATAPTPASPVPAPFRTAPPPQGRGVARDAQLLKSLLSAQSERRAVPGGPIIKGGAPSRPDFRAGQPERVQVTLKPRLARSAGIDSTAAILRTATDPWPADEE